MNALLIIFFVSYGIYALFNNIRFWIIYLSLVISYTLITQTVLGSSFKEFVRRKISIASWSTPNDPQTYTAVKLDVTKIEPYLEKLSKEIGEHVTLTIFSIKLMAVVLKRHPEVYGFIRFGRYVPKDNVDVCCLVQVGDGHELANTTIKNCELKSFKEISHELKANVDLLRKRKNKDQVKKMTLIHFLPTFLIGPIMQILSYLSSIGIALNFIGLKSHEFGSCVITSVGSIGIEDSFAPIPALTFAPMLVTICKRVCKYVYGPNGDVKERKYLKMNFTSDYRFFDVRTSRELIEEIHKVGEDPEIFEAECQRVLEEETKKKERKKKVE